jgi:hypothetical protein
VIHLTAAAAEVNLVALSLLLPVHQRGLCGRHTRPREPDLDDQASVAIERPHQCLVQGLAGAVALVMIVS